MKSRSKSHASNIQQHRVHITMPTGREARTESKYWTKARPNPSGQTPDPVIPVLYQIERHSSLLGWFLCPNTAPLGRYPHGAGISNILGSLVKSRVHFHSFVQWPVWVSLHAGRVEVEKMITMIPESPLLHASPQLPTSTVEEGSSTSLLHFPTRP